MAEYRTGGHWRVTIVEEGTEPFDATGHRPDARLRAVVMDGKVLTTDPELAERVCALLNADDRCWHGEHCDGSGPECERDAPLKGGHRDCAAAWHANHGCATEPFDSCTCTKAGPDPTCIVHQGRRARGPKPPPLGPGCICDGSGRTCPRRGAVI